MTCSPSYVPKKTLDVLTPTMIWRFAGGRAESSLKLRCLITEGMNFTADESSSETPREPRPRSKGFSTIEKWCGTDVVKYTPPE